MSEEFSEHISVLKQKRIEHGLSLEMVHEATKIPLDVLRAIEEGYKVRTLTPFYYKAFLRTYAKYLDVDPEEAINQFKAQEDQKGIRLTKVKPKKEFVPPKSKLSKEMEKFWTPERKVLAFKAVGALVALFIVFKVLFFIGHQIGQWVQSWGKKKEVQVQEVVKEASAPTTKSVQQKKSAPVVKREEKSAPKVQQKPAPKPVEKKTDPVRPQPVKQVQKEIVTKSIRDDVTVTVRAARDAFLIVQADGNTVFQSLLKKGAVETWTGNDQIIISGKNIGYLEFEVNGRMIGGLSRGDSKAKKVTISKNGLSVQK